MNTVCTSKGIDTWINGPEQRAQKQTFINVAIWPFIEVYKQFIGEMVVFSSNGTNGHPYAEKKINPNLNLTPYTKNNSKWCIDINIKHKALKLLENIGENLYNLSLGKKKNS